MLVRTEKKIRQSVIIYITYGHSSTIKKISERIRIKFFSIGHCIREINSCLLNCQFCKKRLPIVVMRAGANLYRKTTTYKLQE
jgi:hypothetical protein